MSAQAIYFEGLANYKAMAEVQDLLVQARIQNQIPDTVLFLQHADVITLGRRGRESHLRLTKEEYQQRNIDVVTASRGGDVTYHAPGQWVIYPIIHLGDQEADAHGYLYNLEEIAIATIKHYGIDAFRRPGKNGAWTGLGKMAAMGFHLKQWVTSHGLSFNINIDLAGYDSITPCGLLNEPVTSLQQHLTERTPTLEEVRHILCENFSFICHRPLTTSSIPLPPQQEPDILYKLITDNITKHNAP